MEQTFKELDKAGTGNLRKWPQLEMKYKNVATNGTDL